MIKECKLHECKKPKKKKDCYCSMHRARFERTGIFDLVPRGEKIIKKCLSRENGCLEYQGCRDKEGYGILGYNKKKMPAHRAMWIICKGEISKGLLVLHKCDNPCCVNLKHLFLGTHQDNSDDKCKKNRQSKLQGINHPMHKLKEKDVLWIRKNWKTQQNTVEFEKKFNVKKDAITRIIKRKSWAHI